MADIETIEKLLNRGHHVELSPDGAVNSWPVDYRRMEERLARLESQYQKAEAERVRLDSLINNPHVEDFLEAIRLEAAHQRERWGSEHDEGKADSDWFWLIGYLAGKALSKPEKQLHHIITTAAACLNWHAARTGADTSMRPGIAEPNV